MSSRTLSVCPLVVYSAFRWILFEDFGNVSRYWIHASVLVHNFCVLTLWLFEFPTLSVYKDMCFFLEHFAFPFAHNTLTKWIFKYSVHFGQWGKELQHFPYHISAVFYQHTHKCEQAHAHKIIPTSLPEICSYRPDILLCLRLHWQCFIATLEACLTYKRHTDLHMTINVGNFLQQRLIQVDW